MRTIPLLIMTFCATFRVVGATTDTNLQYLIDAKVFSIPSTSMKTNVLNLVADFMTTDTKRGTWDMQLSPGQSSEEWLKEMGKVSGAEMVSAPRVSTRAGQPAVIEITQSVTYLEPTTNGLYRAKQLENDMLPGIQLGVNAQPASDGKVSLDLDFTYNLLIEMGDLPGVTAKAGVPVIEQKKLKTTMELPLNTWAIMAGSGQKVRRVDDKREELIFVMVRVSEVDATGRPIKRMP